MAAVDEFADQREHGWRRRGHSRVQDRLQSQFSMLSRWLLDEVRYHVSMATIAKCQGDRVDGF